MDSVSFLLNFTYLSRIDIMKILKTQNKIVKACKCQLDNKKSATILVLDPNDDSIFKQGEKILINGEIVEIYQEKIEIKKFELFYEIRFEYWRELFFLILKIQE